MIGLQDLTAGIARYVKEQTGIAAFADRAAGPVYPCLTVTAKSKSAGIIACGRQVERQVAVTVTCHPSRQRGREEGLELADRVYDAIMLGIRACGRSFLPREVEIQADAKEQMQVDFLLEFCDTPSGKQSADTVYEAMGTLSLRLEQKREGS